MTMNTDISNKRFLKLRYGLTDKEVLEAEKMHRRSTMSLCAAAKVIKERRKDNA